MVSAAKALCIQATAKAITVTSESDTQDGKRQRKVFYFENKERENSKEGIKLMQKDMNVPVMAIVNDLDALITEIDENPQLSAWIVRLVLKSIKDKARKMVYESPLPAVSTSKISHLEAVSNTSTIGIPIASVLR